LVSLLFILFPALAASDPLRVVILDTGLDLNDFRFHGLLCKKGHRNFTGTELNTIDNYGHGTHITGIVKNNTYTRNYCLIIVKYFNYESENYEKALKYSVSLKPEIIVFASYGEDVNFEEQLLIKVNKAIIFIVAAGNKGVVLNNTYNDDIVRHCNEENKCLYTKEHQLYVEPSKWERASYPASYNFCNVYSVGNLTKEGIRNPSSNWGTVVDAWEVGTDIESTIPDITPPVNYDEQMLMTGTSQAAAKFAARVIDNYEEYKKDVDFCYSYINK